MRLLHARTHQLEVFQDERELPQYAILSHTWGKNEITFEDITARLTEAQAKPSYSKIRGTCNLAIADGYDYVWIDLCCIDKASSAELSEAINSMYRWYENAEICYVHLEDVSECWGSIAHFESSEMSNDAQIALINTIRWFQRGWTLQELIAPQAVSFFNAE